MAAAPRHWEQDKEATVYVGNLDERVTDSLVWELMLQAGRIVNVHLPKDRVTQTHQGYGFVEFISEDDASYAAQIMNQVRIYGKPIRVNKASADKQKSMDVGAELFIGNLDGLVDEKTLYDTFSRFGTLVAQPKIARDEANLSKGYGFVSFSNFESADEAVANMHGQYLANKEITVQYAYKKDGKGERHGDAAERLLASQAREHNMDIQAAAAAAANSAQNMFNPPPQMGMGGGGGNMPGMGPMGGMPNGHAMPPAPSPMNAGGYGMGMGGPPPNGFGQPMYPNAAAPQPPRQALHNTPLPPAPAGLPPRPPPSMASYGRPPPGYPAPGFQQLPPQGFAPPAQRPPGFMPPQHGSPVALPPGFQPPR